MKTLFLPAVVLLLCMVSCAQTQQLYPVPGTYKGLTGQGMAIWGDNAYIFNHSGLCRVYNLKTQTVTSEFYLGSRSETTHVNSANFGREIPEGGDKPALYVGECKADGRCFVENIMEGKSELLQTIQATKDGENFQMKSWAVDAENGFIYGISRGEEYLDDNGTVWNTIHKFPLPRLNEGGLITLTEDDAVDRFSIPFPNVIQGMKVRGRYLYIVTGFQQSVSHQPDARRAIKVIDLKKKELRKSVDLTDVVVNEPEDMDFYRNRPLLFCGQEGGIYRIVLK